MLGCISSSNLLKGDSPVLMSFRSVFIAIVAAFALILAAFLVNRARPKVETEQPTADFVRASGKCAECHARLQYPIVHEYEMSAHAKKGINCLDCHQPAQGQSKVDHHGFVIAEHLTAGNCRSCHENEYQEFLRSRHAGSKLGRGARIRRSNERASCIQRAVPARWNQPAAEPAGDAGGPRGRQRRVRAVPRRGQAQRRRHDRHVH
ncbi:ammonia-forming cytochrome c nitrite reductase subunit c552 [Acidobacteria bacterium AB60]|nr:ammonia-forming cytochrome c nitrite reductase subunit c552 [Acidobacteria bacterium AB60]